MASRCIIMDCLEDKVEREAGGSRIHAMDIEGTSKQSHEQTVGQQEKGLG